MKSNRRGNIVAVAGYVALSIMCWVFPVLAQGGRVGPYKGFGKGECTAYAAMRFDQAAPVPGVNWRGNAAQWVDNADKAGWKTSRGDVRAALPNSIICWSDGGAGHVAVVEQMTPGGIEITEQNWPIGAGVTRSKLTWNQADKRGSTGKYRFVGYILPIRK